MQGFARPRANEGATRHLYVAKCRGFGLESVRQAFNRFGQVLNVCEADSSGTRVIVSYGRIEEATAARDAWNRRPSEALNGTVMVIEYAVPRPKPKLVEHFHVFAFAKELGIPGLQLLTDFISRDEEVKLIQEVDARPWQVLAKRRVQHYGYEFLYKVRNVDTSKALGELPDFVQPLLRKFSVLQELLHNPENTFPFDQLTVNEYPRGVGLSPHIDTHSAFEGSIISLSLGGSCVMEFRKYNRDLGLQERRALFLPQRSLVILSQESRYAWHHYIPHHKMDFVDGRELQRATRRVSYTFRKVRKGPCCCTFREYCDSQLSANDSDDSELWEANEEHFETTLNGQEYFEITHNCGEERCEIVPDTQEHSEHFEANKETAQKHSGDYEELSEETLSKEDALPTPEIEKTYVHKVYDAIAPHFSATRFAKWPKVAEFLVSLPPGSLVLDAGCGNGKYLGLNKECFFIGCDISPSLVSICARREHEVLVGDAVNIPVRSGYFDAGISIAVLHHLSTENRRRRAVIELLRVVKKGGKVLVTVWAAEQEDKNLVKRWTPLDDKCVDEWVGDGIYQKTSSKSQLSLERIEETEEQQEYFVPWHLPCHRAEIAGSAKAVASGFARKDDKKNAVVYNRYYHVFVKGELERLVSGIEGSAVVDLFFDKSNWCVILQKL